MARAVHQGRMEQNLAFLRRVLSVVPVTRIVMEMGQFDTQVLKAVEEGRPLPEGTDYQQGEAVTGSPPYGRQSLPVIITPASAAKRRSVMARFFMSTTSYTGAREGPTGWGT